MPLNRSELKKNTAYAFTAQFLALVLSVIMSLIVPKLIGIKAFSYWQLFIFYTQYGGFLHLGLNDGVYLRIGGREYASLDYDKLGSEYKYAISVQTVLCLVICILAFFFCGKDRYIIILLSCVCTIINNTITYFGYILQAVNNIKAYSISQILEKIAFIFILCLLFIFRSEHYVYYVGFYIATRVVAMAYCMYESKEIVMSKLLKWKNVINDLFENVKVGLTLTFSNVASMLILGFGRFFTDASFGIVEFGKLSFAIMLTNFFLVFMMQISLVLFPALRRLQENELSKVFSKINSLLTFIAPMALISFPIISLFISYWVPSYKKSLDYLVFLLPLVCYDGKMQLLFNTFLKVSRKEKLMLLINIISCIASLVITCIAVHVFHSIEMIALGMLIAVVIRSIMAEYYLGNLYGVNPSKSICLFAALCLSFIIAFYFFNLWTAWTIYTTLCILSCFFNRKSIANLKHSLIK